MIIHRSEDRGKADFGWLKSYHSFSFGDYFDSKKMNFGALRVLNDDCIIGGSGFGTHPHQNMEIVSIPLAGALAHKDSTGTAATITSGEVQIMSAGTGIQHSEFNASSSEDARFLQIWVLPLKKNIKPRYEQKKFSASDRKDKFQIVVSPDARNGSLTINQNAFFSIADISKNQNAPLIYNQQMPNNWVYFFLIEGEVEIANESLKPRDAIGIIDKTSINVVGRKDSTLLAIEVPPLNDL